MPSQVCLPDELLLAIWVRTDIVLPPVGLVCQHVLVVVVPSGKSLVGANAADIWSVGRISVPSVAATFLWDGSDYTASRRWRTVAALLGSLPLVVTAIVTHRRCFRKSGH